MASAAFPNRVVAGDATVQSLRARWATVRVKTAAAEFVGRLLVPESGRKTLAALCADRQFVFLTQVCVNHEEALEPFLAISRRYIKAISVLDESEPEALPASAR
jgi:hypothetical protein